MERKSILKNPVNPNQLVEQSSAETPEQTNRRIALFHANRIQAQKDVENQIFEAIEALLEFPRDLEASSSEPSSSDLEQFQKLISLFQVSDYDNLLDERRMADKCGYVFCPNPPQKQGTTAKYRVLGLKKGQDLKIVETKKLELWCSPQCARRALYIKVQLLEEPAWLRRGGAAPPITLLRDDDLKAQSKNITDDELKRAMEVLAIERGDRNLDATPLHLVEGDVVEHQNTQTPTAPTSAAIQSIEGHEPTFSAFESLSLPLRGPKNSEQNGT